MWQGSAAASFAAAHTPYVAWLFHASADSAATAVQHEFAAAAYSAALAAMPTLAELTANRTAHVALVATNFFGINTIPITLNESDYVRMWIQAATAMTVYQAGSAVAVASTPAAVPAPQILKSEGQTQSEDQSGAQSEAQAGAQSGTRFGAQPAASLDPGRALLRAAEPFLKSLGIDPLIRNPLVSNVFTEFIADILEIFGVDWDPGAGLLNGLDYEYYADATQPMWYLARGLELIGDTMQMSQNPAQALQYFVALSVFDWPTHIAQLGTAITQSPLLFAVAGGAMVLPAATAGGFAGLAGLAGVPHPAAVPAPPPGPASLDLPAAGIGSSATSFVSTSGTAPAPAPAPSTAAPLGGTAAPAPPPPGTGFTPPYLMGPPHIGFGSGMSSSASARAKKKAPAPDSAAAAAKSPAAIRRQARARQRKRTAQRHYGDEYMDMDVTEQIEFDPEFDALSDDELSPSAAASNHGAGRLGLPGTVREDTATEATGFTNLPSDQFGGGPTMPMVPGTWR
jgi:PPE-repeat protein